ncbi:MAG TPA: phage holin family protein [Burkholderiaceae bacterium]|nr:phage holin family protein [Burkholderiaceae bacterium]
MNRDEPLGLPAAVSRVAGGVVGLLQNRIELAGLEIGEASERLVFTLVASFAAVLLFGGALVALSAWLAVAWWATLGQAVLGWLALAYALAGAALLAWLRARLRAEPPLLAETLAELRTDATLLRGETPARDGAPR